jgi:hypothetical protein
MANDFNPGGGCDAGGIFVRMLVHRLTEKCIWANVRRPLRARSAKKIVSKNEGSASAMRSNIEITHYTMKALLTTLVTAIVLPLAGVGASWAAGTSTLACWHMKHVLPGATTVHQPPTSNVLCYADTLSKSQECRTACETASR